jgi:hypothetical protein
MLKQRCGVGPLAKGTSGGQVLVGWNGAQGFIALAQPYGIRSFAGSDSRGSERVVKEPPTLFAAVLLLLGGPLRLHGFKKLRPV